MNEYTASNGVRIEDRGGSLYANGNLINGAGSTFRPALAEFFRAEEDERLGRWRWHEDASFVVYRCKDFINVVDERTGTSHEHLREDVDLYRAKTQVPDSERAARAYFDAHPEPKPAWHDAIPGESWALVYLNEEVPAVASSSESGHIIFTASTNQRGGTEEFRTDSKHITAGRRIWPES